MTLPFKSSHTEWPRIAVVASACEFPDAGTPSEFWNSILTGRRSFRRLPATRLRLQDYASGHADPDSIQAIEAGLIKDYVFDRTRFRIPENTFEATDLSHWLALDVASRAVSDLADWGSDQRLMDGTAVIVANTLTGEFSRAALMRTRWPFVAATAREALRRTDVSPGDATQLLDAFEQVYKSAFVPPCEETLAGGLSNTIAGRISNFHGLHGGAFAVDGACASSLVAVSNACEMLQSGSVECVVVGGVDLSIDPFELVGFSRVGALARDGMRVFDATSNGFWPAEGCGFIVIAVEDAMERHGWPMLGWLRGWGISSDGHGGLTRPSVDGQRLALQRAYRRAALSPALVDHFEAHGTGTPTGDPVEIRALALELGEHGVTAPRSLGSVKANVGHMKAAAGMAGLINALAVATNRHAPPLAGLQQRHPLLDAPEVRDRLSVSNDARSIDTRRAAIVGVSGFGFGGINAHIVLEGPCRSHHVYAPRQRADCDTLPGELFMLSAESNDDLASFAGRLELRAETMSHAEMGELAAACARRPRRGTRAWVLADSPQQLERGLRELRASLLSGNRDGCTSAWGWGFAATATKVAFVFPGQGQRVVADPQRWLRRFPFLRADWQRLQAAARSDTQDTAALQALLAEIAIAGVDMLRRFGLSPALCLGHSFGEIGAMHAACMFDAETFRSIAKVRGETIAQGCERPGAMVHAPLSTSQVRALAVQHDVDLACCNGPASSVLSGSVEKIESLVAAARAAGLELRRLPSRVAFHSRELQGAVAPMRRFLESVPVGVLACPLSSTITGALLRDESPRELLAAQITSPVLFESAARELDAVELVIEIGCGDLMCGMLAGQTDRPRISIDLAGASLHGLLEALGKAWVRGADVDQGLLFRDRDLRAFDLDATATFFSNRCDAAITSFNALQRHDTLEDCPRVPIPSLPRLDDALPSATPGSDNDIEEALRAALAAATGLPSSLITSDTRMLTDLHMNSLRLRHVVTGVARAMGLAQPTFELIELADAPLRRLRDCLAASANASPHSTSIPGIEPWLRYFAREWTLAAEVDRALGDTHPACTVRGIDGRVSAIEACNANPESTARWHAFTIDHEPGNDELCDLLSSVQGALRDPGCEALAFVQAGPWLDSFALSISREHPRLCVVLLETPRCDAAALRLALALAGAAEGWIQRRVGADGRLEQTSLVSMAVDKLEAASGPQPSDVVLITGGAKGIGAEIATSFAACGCRIALIGRSPAEDAEVQVTLGRLRRDDAQVAYASADLRDPDQTRDALARLQEILGPVSWVVHSCGVNTPCPVIQLSARVLLDTLDAKTSSLHNVLDALGEAPTLRRLLGFGSIIGELGLAGEAHYALANQRLARMVHDWCMADPRRDGCTLAWSAWKEAGMATRLEGVLEHLEAGDTRALTTVEALRMFDRMLVTRGGGRTLVVSGRHGAPPPNPSPLEAFRFRFVEKLQVLYPGVELIADATIRCDSDRYLADHAPGGVSVFPLVFAIEAMAQGACALMARDSPPIVHDLRIEQAITIAPEEALVLRTRALRREDGSVLVDLLCSSSGFAIAHFQARMTWGERAPSPPTRPTAGAPRVPATPLYGNLLFHGKLFRTLEGYDEVRAQRCRATVCSMARPRWFSALLPDRFVAGDPGLRDGVIHALQACVPHMTVLPVNVQRVELHALEATRVLTVIGRETWSDGTEFLFDIDVLDDVGSLVERWTQLRLRRLRLASELSHAHHPRSLPSFLLGTLAERLFSTYAPDVQVRAGIDALGGRRSQRRSRALAHATASPALLTHDRHGAPRIDGRHVSVTHGDELSLVVLSSATPVACDLQSLPGYDDDEWRDILGAERVLTACSLARSLDEPFRLAALRVWTASEVLSKLGRKHWPFPTHRWRRDTSELGAIAFIQAEGVFVLTAVFTLGEGGSRHGLSLGLLQPAPMSDGHPLPDTRDALVAAARQLDPQVRP